MTLTVDDPTDPADASVHAQAVTVDSPPVAAFSVSPQSPRKNDTVTFDATASSDPDGDPLSYRWDFDGNGTTDGEGAQITHSYPAVGSYQATLTVDDGTLTHTGFSTVTVGSAAPSATITPSTTSPSTGQAGHVHLVRLGPRRHGRGVGVGPRRRRPVRRRHDARGVRHLRPRPAPHGRRSA